MELDYAKMGKSRSSWKNVQLERGVSLEINTSVGDFFQLITLSSGTTEIEGQLKAIYSALQLPL